MTSKLTQAREKRGLTQIEAGELIGMSHSQLGRYEKREDRLTLGLARKLAKAYGCNLLELIDTGSEYLLVNVLGKVAAGEWRDAVASPEEDQRTVPYMPRNGVPLPDAALEVEGESMNLVYRPNTVLFIKHIDDTYVPRTGQRVIVERRRGDEVEVTCKEVEVIDGGQTLLRPRSSHPAHQTPVSLKGRDGDEIVITAVVVDSLQPEPVI